MHPRNLVAIALLITAFATFTAPGHRTSATTPPPPTCTDPRPGGQTYTATAFLTSPGTLTGTSKRDVLVGSTGDDVINGLGGDDLICGNGGNDTIDGGNGNDVISADPYPGEGFSQVHGGAGDDWIVVVGNAHGDGGNDVILGADGGTVWGDTGNDEVTSNNAVAAYGGSGNDTVFAIGSPLGDGGSGNDFVGGQYETTVLRGGSGNDTLVGNNDFPVKNMDGDSGRDTCTPFNAPSHSCETLN